ncbi:baseplate wedge subunit [Acinetobacter phage Acj9]|uniref:Gp11 base plate wedge completion tail pin protein n=1 Tax=Acinetobacter phage Acj9 TaxID=760939 RepID=E5EPV2_9CAUD|nr:baseplate wedge subunit [Acinetobacter phage Acj9]ADG60068.1 gp11 base plate wedge completion tail pin protein [Acinetobacter phage Acj9]
MSNNLTLSRNISRDASFHKFATKHESIIIGNNQPYGSPTINQTLQGIHYANTQSAIDDCVAMFEMPKGACIINTTGVSPAAISQVDDFTFVGNVSIPGATVGSTAIIDFYGFPVTVTQGDTGEEVASKVKIALETAASQNHVFSSVGFGSTLDILQIRYIDGQTHILPQTSTFGVKVTQTIASPAKPGYGVWRRIGTETKTLDGAATPITLYYFEREA